MSGRAAIACAFGAALSSLGLSAFAKDAPVSHPGPWPIYDWRNHQPTRHQLHTMHMHDLTPNEAREVDRLYDQLESSSARILKQQPALVH
jgi:Spy/CpxP family protein refolding chaperone